jgi:hypothetical protein
MTFFKFRNYQTKTEILNKLEMLIVEKAMLFLREPVTLDINMFGGATNACKTKCEGSPYQFPVDQKI